MKYMPLLILKWNNGKVRGVFLYSKTFDWLWHEELIFKIKCKGVKCDLALIESFLLERPQRVVLNLDEQESEWLTIKTGVTQGLILAPLFFLCILTIYQIT